MLRKTRVAAESAPLTFALPPMTALTLAAALASAAAEPEPAKKRCMALRVRSVQQAAKRKLINERVMWYALTASVYSLRAPGTFDSDRKKTTIAIT
jgi:hypothetical protein